jgi:hypothetical protein
VEPGGEDEDVDTSSTLSRLSAANQLPLSCSMRFTNGGYVGVTLASSAGSSPICSAMYWVKIARIMSLAALTDRSGCGQSGSITSEGMSPSEPGQNSRKRYQRA